MDPKLLKRFKRLLQRTRAKVVLSSTWRYDPAGIFSAKHWGIPFIDVIPDMPKRPRRDEVLAWLKTHPKVKRFVVIDDEDDQLDQLPLSQPSANTGLTERIAKGVANYPAGKRMRTCDVTLWFACCKTLNPPSKSTRANVVCGQGSAWFPFASDIRDIPLKIGHFHDRQVVVLDRSEWAAWLNSQAAEEDLLKPNPPGSLKVEKVAG